MGGYNFGTGSSREQAATALKYAGLRLVLAGSFSETFKRNAINNGLLVLEAPELVEYLRQQANQQKQPLTKRTGLSAHVYLDKGFIQIGEKQFSIPTVGLIAQEIMVQGGLENWVCKQVA